MTKKLNLTIKLKLALLLISSLTIIACTEEDEVECETEVICFDAGGCIERPVNFEDCF